MDIFTNLMKLAGGIGLFLFAMYLLEESLKNLSGRNFKIFLQRITKNRFGAVTGGAIVTAILQSSSMVSLMVLAFVGAGVFTMKNAMSIILGANLGTTIDSWLVATLGFKVNIEVAAYPAVCIGGLLLMLLGHKKSYKYISYFLFGFGLLFIGLSFMKTAMEEQVKAFDFSQYANMSLYVFLIIGFLITLVVQSSSVTMALTLSALHAGALNFPQAAALVLGSEAGTTIKIILGSLGGTASKKRVALGNFLFNVVLTILAFIFLKPILLLITEVFNFKDPLIGLVTFSSLVNLFAIFLFLPFLNPYTKLLEWFFKDTDASAAAFLGDANVNEPESSLDLIRKEIDYFIHNSILFNISQFEIDTTIISEYPEFNNKNLKRNFSEKLPEEKYQFLKQHQGEIQSFYLALRVKIQSDHNSELNQLISSVRSAMHSVKSMKDIGANINNLMRSSKDIKFEFFLHHQNETKKLYFQLNELMRKEKTANFKILRNIYNDIQNNYSTALNEFYKKAQTAPLEDLDLTTAINFNRELFTANKAMLIAIKDFLLDEKQADEFNEVPIYMT
ncbi:MAG: Na/Pi cotransporter family protein [Saprospiraceae bacterium]|nr:Na/Pi cotransporter family protein [Saprospiraceae bacterium]